MASQELDLGALNPPLNPVLVTTEHQLSEVSSFLLSQPEIGYDVETNVASTFLERKLRTIQVGNREIQYVIDLLSFAGSPEALRQQGWHTAPKWAKPIVDALSPALESQDHIKVGVNLEFDYATPAWNLGLRPFRFYDCQLVEKIIYAGQVNFFLEGFWGMADMFERYTGYSLNKTLQTSFDLETPLTQDQINYAAFDVRAPFVIKSQQAIHITKAGLARACDIENDCIGAFGDLHINGFFLDGNSWLKVVEEVKAKHLQNINELDVHFLPTVGAKSAPTAFKGLDGDLYTLEELEAQWRDEKEKGIRADRLRVYRDARRKATAWQKESPSWEGQAAINYGSNQQLLAALQRIGKPSGVTANQLANTNDRTLSKFVTKHAGKPQFTKIVSAVKAVQEYRSTKKALDTYGESFLQHISPITGRIHAAHNQLGAETGRTSCTKPNLYNIPQGKEYRSSFRAQKDEHVLITIDMAGAELRILAEMSGDPLMLQAFENGWDLHSYGAEIIFGQEWKDAADEGCAYYHQDHQKCGCKKHKALRNRIKSINFGIAYGMEAGKLADDTGLPKEEAQALLDKWRSIFTVAAAWLTEQGNATKIKLAGRTLSGRRRLFKRPDWDECREKINREFIDEGKGRLPTQRDVSRLYYSKYSSIEREGKNTPIQGSNADIAKIALGAGFDADGNPFMWHILREFGARLVNFVYDEVVVECHIDKAPELMQWIGNCIKRAAAMLMSKVVMEWEGKIAPCWSK